MGRSAAVDGLIGDWPEPQQAIAELLRSIILDASPAINESVKFNIPFYTMNGMLFYISPNRKGGVLLAFCLGRHMADPLGIFTGHDRKEVRHIPVSDLDRELLEAIQDYVLEAVELNRTRRSFTQETKRSG